MNNTTRILVAVATCVGLGFIAGQLSQSGEGIWYDTIEKPVFNPPSWVFGPVWTILYIMMGVSAGMIWNRINEEPELVRKGLRFFAIQFALNLLWSFLFFTFENPLLALIEIVILWLMIYETFIIFRKVNKTAALLLLPYLAWVTFATVLNASIWWLNK